MISPIITLIIIVVMIVLLLFTKIKMDVVFLLGMLAFMSTGILSDKDVFSSFVSNACIFVAFLSIIIGAMKKNGSLQWLMQKCLRDYKSFNSALLTLTSLSSLLSTLIANPAMGMIMYDSVKEWARKQEISYKKFLLLVAVSISIGGSLLTIGKSSGLLWAEITSNLTGREVSICAPFIVGSIVLIVTFVCMFLFRNRIDEKPESIESRKLESDICAELIVDEDSDFIGKTLAEAQCYVNEDFHVVQMTTAEGGRIYDVSPNTVMHPGDHFVFCGDTDVLLKLGMSHNLLTANEIHNKMHPNKKTNDIYQCGLVMPKGALVGKKLSEIDFEEEYDVMLTSLYREGGTIITHPRETVLKGGDYITFYGKKLPWSQLEDTLIYQKSDYIENYDWRTIFSAVVLVVVILLSISGLLSLPHAAFMGAMAVGISGCIGHKEAWSSIGWSTITVIAGAKTIGLAITQSGLADIISGGILSICGTSPIVSLCILTFISVVLTQVLFDNAAMAFLLPLAITIANHLGTDVMPFAIAIFMGCSANLCTGICTPHMSMAMIQGQYSNRDMWRYGWPLAIVQFVTIIVATVVCYNI